MSIHHWTSYNAHEGPSFLPEDGRTLMISVILDAGSQEDFEGIRVIIVRRETEGADMSVKERTDPARSSYVTGVNYRKTLTNLRSREKNRGHLTHMTEGKKICTVIFELAPTQTYWGQFARLVLIDQQTSSTSLRIIHDHFEHSVSSTLLFLHCSHSPRPEFSPGGSIRKPTRVRAHDIRVIPVPKSRPPWPTFSLPPALLSRIVLFAFSEKQKGWRKGLLACSLVCRAWAYLADLVFNDFLDTSTSRTDHDPPNITTVSRSLLRNVARGLLITSFSPTKYLRPTRVTNVAFMAFCEAQNTILRIANSVIDMSLESTHAFLFQDFYDILCGLRNVQNLRVTRSHRFGPPAAEDVRHLTFEEIMKIITFWPDLRKLRIVNWKSLPESTSSFGGAGTENIIASSIENLNLSIGRLGGAKLLSLTGPSHSPTHLRVARFDAVKGLTNSDLLAFLLRVAPTLTSLSITACPIPRSSDDEEYAIDVAMPCMTSLENLLLDGDLSTANALTRKVRRRPRDDNKRRHRISLSNPPMMILEDVLEAVSITGWESICVYLESSMGCSIRSSVEVAQVARTRGIDFRVSISPRELASPDGF
ncbi:hypothetical protein DXG01_010656 [Tephrocybe rancida]|nr:hypothetical protein DXG01_010656 [Tephrocybe rancida]